MCLLLHVCVLYFYVEVLTLSAIIELTHKHYTFAFNLTESDKLFSLFTLTQQKKLEN